MEFTTSMMQRLRDFASEQLARQGLQRKPSLWATAAPWAGFFAGGLVFGLAIGLLIAPQSGAETRAAIRRKAAKAGRRAGEIYGNIVHRGGEQVEAHGAADVPSAEVAGDGNGKSRAFDGDQGPASPQRA